jgi:outer membrane protein assembly factor BamB
MDSRLFRKYVVLVTALVVSAATALSAATATDILKAGGVKGGLVVHVGCGDGSLTAALRANERYVVHGLDTDAAGIAAARKHIHSLGLYGKVSVDVFDGKTLPYVDGTVNLLVMPNADCQLPNEEITRVLAPLGVALVNPQSAFRNPQSDVVGKWRAYRKPFPDDIDEWSHFLHDAGGNAVAEDSRIGPPRRLRWVAGPRWCRSHEFPSSVGAVVTAGGRIFTIFDESPSGVYKKLPQRCSLIARDAFNGTLLWKVPLQDWQPEFGTGIGNRWQIHHTIPRRVVTDGDRVYATLRFLESPVSVLDAATGEVITEALPGTKGADELILSEGILVAKLTKKRSVAASARIGKGSLDDTLVAVDVKTGKQLWRKEDTRVVPYALSARAGRVVYHDMDALVCLDARSGKQLWASPNDIASTLGAVSTLVIEDDVVLFHGNGPAEKPIAAKNPPKKKSKRPPKGRFVLTALSLKDGKPMWSAAGARGWAAACTQPTGLFVTKGVVWCGTLQGRELKTGKVVKQPGIGKLISPGHHYRCHRGKASERYLILPKRGAEFVDVEGDNHMRNDWLRAPCFTGPTPANGLLYIPPSQCFCYPGAKVYGYLALAAGESKVKASQRLEKGPAYGGNLKSEILNPKSEDWPMYRRDGKRSGSTPATVPVTVKPAWEIALACRGSQPVVVGNRLWVAEKDAHRIRCLDAETGKDVWTFTAGGRIDSAPTIHNGLVLFGCRDGSVYCLRATDGALAWRFAAAPRDERVVSFEQVESLWPVQGSVLVQDEIVYFAAGRSSFLDGGILVYGLDAKTGEVRHHHHLEGPWPDVQKDTGTPFAMEGALPDLFVSDGKDLYMQRIKFDAKLNRLPVKQESSLGELDMGANHLAATGGFLDDTGFDRVYWMYSKRWPGFYFAQHAPKSGQLVVFDDSTTYAVKYFYRRIQWSPVFYPAEQGYLLFADGNDNEPAFANKGVKVLDWLPEGASTDKYRRGGQGVEKGTGYVRVQPPNWKELIPLRVRAMVLAGDKLFAAGTPDVLDPEDPLAAFEGRKGALLNVYSAKDGKLLKSGKLPSPAAFDGMIATKGSLFIATDDGKLLRMN